PPTLPRADASNPPPRAPNAPPAAPEAAQAARTLTASDTSAQDVADFTVAQGDGAMFTGGVTTTSGTGRGFGAGGARTGSSGSDPTAARGPGPGSIARADRSSPAHPV